MDKKRKLELGLSALGLAVEENKQEKMLAYLELLQRWNKTYNLTAIRDPNQMVSNHLLDSMAISPYLWPGKWLDVGCGAGLPGIVLAIAHPEWQFTMLDSNSKKVSFVQQAIIELNLGNALVVCTRVESWVPDTKFDGIVSRAFSEVGDFIRLTRRLVAEGGRWAAMKGEPMKELSGLPQGCTAEKIIQLRVPGLEAARSLVIVGCDESECHD